MAEADEAAQRSSRREIARESRIQVDEQGGITVIWKAIRRQHPALNAPSAHANHTARIATAFASIIDSLNTVRNTGSIAHANDQLLSKAEAMLAVNAARSLLQYLEDTLRVS